MIAISVQRKQCRHEGDRRLKTWARFHAELSRIGFAHESVNGRIVREGLAGAGSRGGDPSDSLSVLERDVELYSRVLLTENLVLSMPEEWRVVVFSNYISNISVIRLAIEMSIERDRLAARLHDAQERVGAAARGILELTQVERELLARLWEKHRKKPERVLGAVSVT